MLESSAYIRLAMEHQWHVTKVKFKLFCSSVKPLLAWCPAKYKNHHRTFLSTLPPIPADQAKGVLRSTLVSSVEHPGNLTLSPHSTLKNPTLELLSPFLNHGTVLFLLCVAAMLIKKKAQEKLWCEESLFENRKYICNCCSCDGPNKSVGLKHLKMNSGWEKLLFTLLEVMCYKMIEFGSKNLMYFLQKKILCISTINFEGYVS